MYDNDNETCRMGSRLLQSHYLGRGQKSNFQRNYHLQTHFKISIQWLKKMRLSTAVGNLTEEERYIGYNKESDPTSDNNSEEWEKEGENEPRGAFHLCGEFDNEYLQARSTRCLRKEVIFCLEKLLLFVFCFPQKLLQICKNLSNSPKFFKSLIRERLSTIARNNFANSCPRESFARKSFSG